MAADDSQGDVFLPSGRLRTDLVNASAGGVLEQSVRMAHDTRWDSIRSPHVFMGLLAAPDQSLTVWIQRLGTDRPKLLDQFRELFHQEEGDSEAVLILNREFLSD